MSPHWHFNSRQTDRQTTRNHILPLTLETADRQMHSHHLGETFSQCRHMHMHMCTHSLSLYECTCVLYMYIYIYLYIYIKHMCTHTQIHTFRCTLTYSQTHAPPNPSTNAPPPPTHTHLPTQPHTHTHSPRHQPLQVQCPWLSSFCHWRTAALQFVPQHVQSKAAHTPEIVNNSKMLWPDI